MLSTLEIERAVMVQPSMHGTDNRVTMDAVRRARGAFRAVVVVDDAVTDAELEALAVGGARGIRLNLLFRSGSEVKDVRRLAERIAPLLDMLADWVPDDTMRNGILVANPAKLYGFDAN